MSNFPAFITWTRLDNLAPESTLDTTPAILTKAVHMAQQVNVSYVDDLDGSEAQGTLSFGLDGKTYEIDLSRENAAKLRHIYARYIDGGRRVGGSARATQTARSATAAADREHNQTIREWALARGMKVSNRGRLPADVVDAYKNKDSKPAVVESPSAGKAEAPVKKPRRSRAKAKSAS